MEESREDGDEVVVLTEKGHRLIEYMISEYGGIHLAPSSTLDDFSAGWKACMESYELENPR